MGSIDKLAANVNAALESPAASADDKNRALALLNETLFRTVLDCRAAFVVELAGSPFEGRITLALFASPAVAENTEVIGTSKTAELFGYLCAVKGMYFMVCKDRAGSVPSDRRVWTTFEPYTRTRHVQFTTLL